jgi:hypothetical protein
MQFLGSLYDIILSKAAFAALGIFYYAENGRRQKIYEGWKDKIWLNYNVYFITDITSNI